MSTPASRSSGDSPEDTPAGEAVESTVIVRSLGHDYVLPMRDGVVIAPKGAVTARTQRHRIPSRGSSRPSAEKVTIKEHGAATYGPAATVTRLIETLGNNAVADILGVAKDRPGRWARGEGSPDTNNRRALADLEGLVGHLLAAFTPEQASLWLGGANALLGARPIDVYRNHGSEQVIEAIRAHEQEAYG
ncbi:hypothetical protein LWF01_15750 [Saxibacter everestensis]|uniref:Antitoxin Xre/MbcA/ParS-like toxin-binding domain-containing protein n=1 Tax=Saxibacter everestensis TaxID=2909229 RepID=A0ABY8QRR9_9MICO|nr:hypothetical protein LWF01_15750 [Brevibacteriaceae bacterium ZFBP1038]